MRKPSLLWHPCAQFCAALVLPFLTLAQTPIIPPLHCAETPLQPNFADQKVIVPGDLDGDGFPDIVFPLGSTFFPDSNSFAAVSGQDCNTVIRIFQGPPGSQFFPTALAPIGDVNGNGVADILVGDKYFEVGNDTIGRALVYEGGTGEIIREVIGPMSGNFSSFGEAVAGGDVDGDMVPDIVVGAPDRFHPILQAPTGSVSAYSGADGSLLYEVFGVIPNEYLGTIVNVAGDVNADGFVDVVATGFEPIVRVIIGPDGMTPSSLIFALPGISMRSVNGVGKIDGDDFDDIAVSYDSFAGGPPIIDIYSGFDGSLLTQIDSGVPGAFGYGYSLVPVDDVDKDGIGDIATSDDTSGDKIEIFSGADGSLIYTITPSLYSPLQFVSFGEGLTSSDITGDGLLDLVTFDGIGAVTVIELSRAFIRGDCDGNGVVNGLVDSIFLLRFVFVPGSPVPPNLEACNVNDDAAGNIDLVDAIYLLNFTFLPGSPPPSAPFPDPGFDP